MPRITEIVVLCEDQNHELFTRRLLEKLGERFRRTPRFLKTTSGSGRQFVEKQFPLEFQAYLKRKQKMQIALIVLIDCDTLTFDATRKQLRESLDPDHRQAFDQTDCLLLLLPKRAVETWIDFAHTELPVDEDFRKKRAHPSTDAAGCKKLASQFYSWSRVNSTLPETIPPSLSRAIEELRRFEAECGNP